MTTNSSKKETKLDDSVDEPTVEELKEQGNQCVRNEHFAEAILHYSHAIKMNQNDPILYSNRSLAFLKLKQLYYANEDAEKAIQLKPDWAKGYFRKAEVNVAAGQYDIALLAYGRAYKLQPNDANILNAVQRAASLSKRETEYDKKIPFLGAGIGMILAIILVIADYLNSEKPVVRPYMMLLQVVILSMIGLGIAKLYRYYVRLQQKGLLEPPVDLLEGFKKVEETNEEDESELISNRTRYSKAQARQRFKKGKTS